MRKVRLTAEVVALVDRTEPDPGPDPERVQMSDADYTEAAADIVARNGAGPLSVFGYGSLLWKPGFEYAERVPASVHGWHRSFCIQVNRFRGSPENPGLMLALDRGGSCRGEVFRIAGGDAATQAEKLLRREVPYRRLARAYRFMTARTQQGPVRALTFYAGMRRDSFYIAHAIEDQARLIARAAGHGGSAAAYLFETVKKLEELGIHDRYIWHLQELVAEEIKSLHSPGRQ